MQFRFEFIHKPRKCPVCRSAHVASFLYGLPIFNEKLEKRLNDGKVVLGGCCVSDGSPVWQCIDCDALFYRKHDPS